MHREIAGGVHWIHAALHSPELKKRFEREDPDWYTRGEEVYSVHNAYLIRGEKNLLYDTLPPTHDDQIIEDVTDILEGEQLDYLLLSHPENPHAGNTFRILDKFPDAKLVAANSPSKTHELYYLGDAIKVDPGDYIDLGSHVVEFVEPYFLDHELHTWAFERSTKTLFTVDFIGFRLMHSEQLKFVDEVEKDLTPERIYSHNGSVFYWWQFVDTEKTDRAIEHMISEYEPNHVASSHCIPIREEPEKYLRMMKNSIRKVIDEGGTVTW